MKNKEVKLKEKIKNFFEKKIKQKNKITRPRILMLG